MVAETYAAARRARSRASTTSSCSARVAFASLMSGAVYNAWGWDMLNWMIFPVVLACLAALVVLALRERRVPA